MYTFCWPGWVTTHWHPNQYAACCKSIWVLLQVIGIHQRGVDLAVNACKKKAATNMRASSKDATVVLSEPIRMGLDDALEYIADDELVEVTPQHVRIRKGSGYRKK